mgnify:CR=1 FL=1
MRTTGRMGHSRVGAACVALALTSAPAGAEVVRAVEYYHVAFEHYFVTANPAEIAALDAGTIAGWVRSGQRYRVDDAPTPGLSPVCRFFTSAFGGKGSHFFTASAAECELLKANHDWTYEGIAFHAILPDAEGSCAAGTAAIHRLYNAGHGGAPNHAYTADPAKRDTLAGADWVYEGVAYCVPLAPGDPLAQTRVLAKSLWDLPSTFLYDHVRIRTRFADELTVSGNLDWTLADFGLPPAAAAIYHGVNDAWNGAATWDPLAGSYVVAGGSGFEGGSYVGNAWLFDDAQGPTAPVCAVTVYRNLNAANIFGEHAFQPRFWSGCETGIASKL